MGFTIKYYLKEATASDKPYFMIQVLNTLRHPRFKLKTVFLGALITYSIILLVLFLAFYSSKGQGTNNRDFLHQQFSANALPTHALSLFFLTLVYYLLLNLCYAGLREKRKLPYFILSALLVLLLLEIHKITDALLFRNYSIADYFNGSIADNLIDRFMGFLLYSLLAVIFVFFALQRDEKERNRLLLEANRKLELEQLQAKHDLLRAQINPHFLHNTLNLIYSRTRQYDRQLANGILLLSDSMRYSIEATRQQTDLVPLQEEITHLRNLISLQQLRFDEKLNIQFTTQGNPDGLQVPPLTLVTLAENAFKHGELYDPENPVSITLSIENQTEARVLRYTVANRKHQGPLEHSHGIGLNNIRQRFEEVFGSRYRLLIADEAKNYSVDLSIYYTI